MPARAWLRRAPIVGAAIVFLPAVVFTCIATYRATFEPLGRDQGIFQYVAWALTRGVRQYEQIHDMNGPLVPIIHMIFLKLGGADERVFRSLDWGLFGVVALFVGASLPGIGSRHGVPPVRVRWTTRGAWALAAWTVLCAGYLLFGWWDHAQRESFFDDFLLPSIACQLWAQRPGVSIRTRRWLFAISGVLSAATWFGKPSCVVFAAGQVLAIVFDDEREERAQVAVAAFLAGCGAACFPMIVFLFAYGDPIAGVRFMLFDVVRLHRYIWHKSIAESYVAWGNAPKLNYALVTLAFGTVAVASRALPRRFLAILVLPVGGLANFVLQGKGFPYHLHAVVAGVHLLWIASAVYAVERASMRVDNAAVGAAALAGCVALGYQTVTETRLCEDMNAGWYADRRAGGPDSELFLRHFNAGDYFALDIHRAAALIRETTKPDDRVQVYGMDPYLLFLSRRLGATPYIYNFELNVDSALAGGPSVTDRDWMVRTSAANAHDLYERMMHEPPAAFVTLDLVPFTFPRNADEDFERHCPEASVFVREHYRLVERFGTAHVWLRNDVPASAARPAG